MLWGANGDADVLGEVVFIHGTEDDAFGEAFVEAGAAVADVDKDEIGLGGNVRYVVGIQRVVELAAALAHGVDGAGEVLGVVDGGACGGLRGDGHVEGAADAVEEVGDVGACDGVADAEAGEPVRLGEGAQDGHAAALLDVFDGVGLLVGEVDVRLVEHHQDVVRHGIHEGIDFLLSDLGADGVGGVGDEDDAGLRGDSLQHGGEVVRPVGLVGNGDVTRVEALGGHLVHHETAVGGHGVGFAVEVDHGEQGDQLAAAGAGDDLLQLHAVEVGEPLAEVVRAAVGVDVGAGEGVLHGLDSLGRGTDGILVGGKLDDGRGVHAELARGFLNGLSGLVGNEGRDVGVSFGHDT